MAYCRECGTEVSIYDDFCASCGNDLDFDPPDPEEDDEPELEANSEPVEDLVEEDEPDEELSAEEESFEEPVEYTAEEETESDDESKPIGILAKILAVICVPIVLAGLFLELASVYTLATGGYTTGEFIVAFIIFGIVTVLPSGYLYYIYKRKNALKRVNSE